MQGTNRIPKVLRQKGAKAKEVEPQEVEGRVVGTEADLFAVGTMSRDPLRLRGGGEGDSSDEESTEEQPEEKSCGNESLIFNSIFYLLSGSHLKKRNVFLLSPVPFRFLSLPRAAVAVQWVGH